jgi:hypothetical protein
MSDSRWRSAPISWALGSCENAWNANEYDCAFRKHQRITTEAMVGRCSDSDRRSLKILAHLIRQNRPTWDHVVRPEAGWSGTEKIEEEVRSGIQFE